MKDLLFGVSCLLAVKVAIVIRRGSFCFGVKHRA